MTWSILVVEQRLEILPGLLREAGAHELEVSGAGSSVEVRKLLEHRSFDGVIADLDATYLPVRGLLERLRRQNAATVCVGAAWAIETTLGATDPALVDYVLTKPVDSVRLARLLRDDLTMRLPERRARRRSRGNGSGDAESISPN